MKIIRPLVLHLLKLNISLQTVHVPGVQNTLADAISRYQQTTTLLDQYGMQHTSTTIPDHLKPENFQLL